MSPKKVNGRISFDEMERLYDEIIANVIRMDMDILIFSNLIKMLKDMISPHSSTYFTLSDLKRSPPLPRYFFNTFINRIKHVTQESCLPDERNFSDWNHFCKSKYEILIADLLDNNEETLVTRILNSLNLAIGEEKITSTIFRMRRHHPRLLKLKITHARKKFRFAEIDIPGIPNYFLAIHDGSIIQDFLTISDFTTSRYGTTKYLQSNKTPNNSHVERASEMAAQHTSADRQKDEKLTFYLEEEDQQNADHQDRQITTVCQQELQDTQITSQEQLTTEISDGISQDFYYQPSPPIAAPLTSPPVALSLRDILLNTRRLIEESIAKDKRCPFSILIYGKTAYKHMFAQTEYEDESSCILEPHSESDYSEDLPPVIFDISSVSSTSDSGISSCDVTLNSSSLSSLRLHSLCSICKAELDWDDSSEGEFAASDHSTTLDSTMDDLVAWDDSFDGEFTATDHSTILESTMDMDDLDLEDMPDFSVVDQSSDFDLTNPGATGDGYPSCVHKDNEGTH
uniref:SPK domain-containing protein n=1 Tax=Elaeophora elaphi TaxID=1147741 RepID=A0A0R3RWQ1_9BILA